MKTTYTRTTASTQLGLGFRATSPAGLLPLREENGLVFIK